MKKKAIVFGLGGGYFNNRQLIENRYDVIAYTDNNEQSKTRIDKNFIEPKEISCYDYDVIVVCSLSFFETMKYQLTAYYQVPVSKIVPLALLLEKNDESHIQKILENEQQYRKLNQRDDFSVNRKNMLIFTHDMEDNAGSLPEHYFAQDIWAARKVYEYHPTVHYDIGSCVQWFLAHLLVFCRNVNYIDIRPMPYEIPGLNFVQGDATDLSEFQNNSIESLSSLHAIEHFGLGRYGDPIDPEACFKAMKAMQRVLKPGGKLILGLPIGPENKLVYNAHRIFNPLEVIRNFNELELLEFSYVEEYKTKKIPLDDIAQAAKYVPDYSCGLFEFTKKY